MRRAKQELIVERCKAENTFKCWKHVLDIIQNPVVIFNTKEILYYNDALFEIIREYGSHTENILNDVFKVITLLAG